MDGIPADKQGPDARHAARQRRPSPRPSDKPTPPRTSAAAAAIPAARCASSMTSGVSIRRRSIWEEPPKPWCAPSTARSWRSVRLRRSQRAMPALAAPGGTLTPVTATPLDTPALGRSSDDRTGGRPRGGCRVAHPGPGTLSAWSAPVKTTSVLTATPCSSPRWPVSCRRRQPVRGGSAAASSRRSPSPMRKSSLPR